MQLNRKIVRNLFQRIENKIRYEFGMLLGRNKIIYSQKPGIKILMIVYYVPNAIITISQTIKQYRDLSRFSVDILNIAYGFGELSETVLLNYSAIIVHNTANSNINQFIKINEVILKRYKGIKVVMKQDEHFMTQFLINFFEENKIDLVLTIWPIETAMKVYKSNGKNKNLHLMHFITGYVPDEYRHFTIDFENRDIDIGYRGSLHSPLYGRLASYEKREIGYLFMPYAVKEGLKCDISSKPEDRFIGEKWLDFLKQCKAVLGVESGSDIVDYTGEVKVQYDRFVAEHPSATEEEILDFVEQFKGEITYRAISPRHFEAAACGALQILYEGEYQGIFKPYVHYVPLKRDFSNIEEVISYIKDDVKRKEIVIRAREDIILSGKYSFRKFTEELDAKLEEIIEERGGI